MISEKQNYLFGLGLALRTAGLIFLVLFVIVCLFGTGSVSLLILGDLFVISAQIILNVGGWYDFKE